MSDFDLELEEVAQIMSQLMDCLTRVMSSPRLTDERERRIVPSRVSRLSSKLSQRRSGKRSTWGPLFCRSLYI